MSKTTKKIIIVSVGFALLLLVIKVLGMTPPARQTPVYYPPPTETLYLTPTPPQEDLFSSKWKGYIYNACNGVNFSQAASYDPNKPGPHPLIMVYRDIYPDVFRCSDCTSPNFVENATHFADPLRDADIYSKYGPYTVEQVQLIACVTRETNLVDSCSYTGFTIFRFEVFAHFRVIEAKTGAEIISLNLPPYGNLPECQYITNENEHIYLFYDTKPIIDMLETLYNGK